MDKTMDKTAVLDLPEALNRVDGGQELFLTLAELFCKKARKRLRLFARRCSDRIVPG